VTQKMSQLGPSYSRHPDPVFRPYVIFYLLLAVSSALIPQGMLMLANSCVISEKAVHTRSRYNIRVVENRAAVRIFAHYLDVSVGSLLSAQLCGKSWTASAEN
jgi:hypothetical protein